MFYKVQPGLPGTNCKISGFGHTALEDDPRFTKMDQVTFIKRMMSDEGRRLLFDTEPPYSEADILAKANKWVSQTLIRERVFFFGSIVELATIAAQKCLEHAGVSPKELDVIIGGTNTGPGYPTLADHVKLALGQESSAMTMDVTLACATSTAAVFMAYNLIRSGVCKKVLVVCAEQATKLTGYDNWKGSNLFGDAAFAFLLEATTESEVFVFFSLNSLPFEGLINKIRKTENGFEQDGNAVHKFVGRTVVNTVVEDVARAGIDPGAIKHLILHQPSGKTLGLVEENIGKRWPTFHGNVPHNVEFMGNTSSASTGWLISVGIHDGTIKRGDLIVIVTFASGLNIGIEALYI
jgi:3-oxoacyl-[acyl-carrier-protein] synthase III